MSDASNIKASIDELLKTIKGSETYKEYIRSRAVLMQDEELYNKVCEYKNKNAELQVNNESVFDKALELSEYYAEYINQPVARAYLNAEGAMCKIFQKINYKLLEDLEFEL